MEPWWQEIANALAEEFSDLPNLAQATRVSVRLLMAAVLSGMLGFEREQKGKASGMRTHMLVGLGSAIFVFIPQQAGVSDADITRVIQGLVAGIGFLGAGNIITREKGESVQGLTTAASIWLTAAIGVAAGMGREASAILSTLLALVILALMPKLAGWFGTHNGDSNTILRG